ncbi:DUF397 domain-containing protein [Actinomadura chibensis]|uniref:DUF397 domain-containing protein n=1 Tax=Actinomadura chibensis TaxID=392828 RepID=A0A5D0NW11_9ACTN|nr:DUF397 domain-containing protein [Actinomadura chibensis]TYB48432.1 DUF397 domain-containing protein [Actinomadura chibensis]
MTASDVPWRKSSRSSGQGGNCVEVANLGARVALRDSKDPDGPSLAFDVTAWRAFTCRVRSSEFDLER